MKELVAQRGAHHSQAAEKPKTGHLPISAQPARKITLRRTPYGFSCFDSLAAEVVSTRWSGQISCFDGLTSEEVFRPEFDFNEFPALSGVQAAV